MFKFGDRVIPKLDIWKTSPDYLKVKEPPIFTIKYVIPKGWNLSNLEDRYFCDSESVNYHIFNYQDILKAP